MCVYAEIFRHERSGGRSTPQAEVGVKCMQVKHNANLEDFT